tara:strand:+ start:4081 stop:6639 length:2559 start_codon:yes stop_codon:yes gene_type:complete
MLFLVAHSAAANQEQACKDRLMQGDISLYGHGIGTDETRIREWNHIEYFGSSYLDYFCKGAVDAKAMTQCYKENVGHYKSSGWVRAMTVCKGGRADKLAIECFDGMDFKVNKNKSGGGYWSKEDDELYELCRNTTNPQATIQCYKDQIADHNNIGRAFYACTTPPMSPITGLTVKLVKFAEQGGQSKGYFYMVGPTAWRQRGDGNFFFVETKRDVNGVSLYDPTRDINVDFDFSNDTVYSTEGIVYAADGSNKGFRRAAYAIHIAFADLGELGDEYNGQLTGKYSDGTKYTEGRTNNKGQKLKVHYREGGDRLVGYLDKVNPNDDTWMTMYIADSGKIQNWFYSKGELKTNIIVSKDQAWFSPNGEILRTPSDREINGEPEAVAAKVVAPKAQLGRLSKYPDYTGNATKTLPSGDKFAGEARNGSLGLGSIYYVNGRVTNVIMGRDSILKEIDADSNEVWFLVDGSPHRNPYPEWIDNQLKAREDRKVAEERRLAVVAAEEVRLAAAQRLDEARRVADKQRLAAQYKQAAAASATNNALASMLAGKVYVRITDYNAGMALDAGYLESNQMYGGVSTTVIDNTRPDNWKVEKNIGQYWRFNKVGDNKYQIISELRAAIKYLTVVGPNANIVTADVKNDGSQYWEVVEIENGKVALRNKMKGVTSGIFIDSARGMQLSQEPANKNRPWSLETIINKRDAFHADPFRGSTFSITSADAKVGFCTSKSINLNRNNSAELCSSVNAGMLTRLSLLQRLDGKYLIVVSDADKKFQITGNMQHDLFVDNINSRDNFREAVYDPGWLLISKGGDLYQMIWTDPAPQPDISAALEYSAKTGVPLLKNISNKREQLWRIERR